LELARRTEVVGTEASFAMKKVYKDGDKKEDKKKNKIR
jgi:hypothetical protein